MANCCGLFQYYFPQLFSADEKLDEHEVTRRIESEWKKWECHNKNPVWLPLIEKTLAQQQPSSLKAKEKKKDCISTDDLWGRLTLQTFPINPYLKNSLLQLEKEGINSGIAVDLGCGNNDSARYLLEKGWKVIAVDNSKQALENFQKRANSFNPDWIRTRQLICKCDDMEAYCFPQNIHLVLANDSLLHCNPLKIRNLFKKIFESLTKEGRFIGNFYIAPKEQVIEELFREVFKGWFSDKALVNFLLEDSGYQTELCDYNSYWHEAKTIEFIGRKA